MLYLPTVLALPFFHDLYYWGTVATEWNDAHYGSFVCSIDGVDAAVNVNPVWNEWNQSDPVVVNIQGQDRTLRIDSIYQSRGTYPFEDVALVLDVDFWVGNADGSDMQKWNYMRFDVDYIKPVDDQHYGYGGIRSSQSDVEETDAYVPGRYKCRRYYTEYLKQ